MTVHKPEDAAYRGYRRAGIRLTEEPPAELHSHDRDDIRPYLYALHMFDKAHVVSLVEEGLITGEHGRAILGALREMEQAGMEATRLKSHGGMHSGEQYLVRLLGEEVGGRIHLGRSSGDLKEVANRILWRDYILALAKGINRFRATLLDRAMEYRETIMPGYSQGQQAQPTTYGHQLLAWASVAARDFSRLSGVYQRVNLSPAGAAIMTGSSFGLNRHRTSDLLGFDRPLSNTIDAIMSHDVLLELHAVVSIVHANLLRWSEDIMLWSANEFGLITLPDRFCGTSSIMMQKKNPNTPQEIKGTSAAAVGGLMTAFIIEKSPTGTAMIDRHASVDALNLSFEAAIRSVSLMAQMAEGITPNTQTMLDQVWRFWAQATDVGAMLVEERGLPWRTAHQIVGILVRLAYERGLTPIDTTTELLDEAAVEYTGQPLGIPSERYRDSLDPRRFVEARTLFGGPAPDQARRNIEEFEIQLREDERTVEEKSAASAAAGERLESAVNVILTRGEVA